MAERYDKPTTTPLNAGLGWATRQGQDVTVTDPEGAHADRIHSLAPSDPDGLRVRA